MLVSVLLELVTLTISPWRGESYVGFFMARHFEQNRTEQNIDSVTQSNTRCR